MTQTITRAQLAQAVEEGIREAQSTGSMDAETSAELRSFAAHTDTVVTGDFWARGGHVCPAEGVCIGWAPWRMYFARGYDRAMKPLVELDPGGKAVVWVR